MPGWHINLHLSKKSKQTTAISKINALNKVKFTSSENLLIQPETTNSAKLSLVALPPKLSENNFKTEHPKPTTINRTRLGIIRSIRPFQNTTLISKKLTIGKLSTDHNDQWTNKLAGGFLGTILALLAILPLFVITLFLMNGDADDLFEFSVSNKSSAFFQAFQNTFNVVFKVGTAILFIALIAFLVGAFISFLYLEYGILGVLLGVLIFILLMFLLIKIFERLFEVFFPGS
jgi:hypothetical protein